MTRDHERRWGCRPDGSIDRRSFLAMAAGLGAATTAGAGLGLPGAALAQAQPLRIGWIRPTTGRLVSTFAQNYVGGLIAIDEINAAGGILGRQIVRQEEDDEASPARQPAIIKKLQDAGIGFIVGPTGSSQTLASMAMTTPAKIIQSAFANAAEIGDGTRYPYHYQVTFNSNQQAEVCVRHLCETLKLKKVGILQENTAFGEQGTLASRAAMKKLGVEPIAVEVYSQTAPDLTPFLSNLRKAGAEGVIAWIASLPNLAMAFNAMHRMKWSPPITGHNGLFYESLFDLVPEEALKNVSATFYRNYLWSPSRPIGERQQAYARKLATYPETRGSGAAVATAPYYDFLHLMKLAIEQEKSFDTDRVKRALDNVRDYDGMLGRISFTPQNHTAISSDQVSLGTVMSARDPRSLGVFREEVRG